VLANVMWSYIVRMGHLDEAVSAEDIAHATRKYGVGAVIYVIAIGVAFFYPRISIVLYAVMALFYLFRGGLESTPASASTAASPK